MTADLDMTRLTLSMVACWSLHSATASEENGGKVPPPQNRAAHGHGQIYFTGKRQFESGKAEEMATPGYFLRCVKALNIYLFP